MHNLIRTDCNGNRCIILHVVTDGFLFKIMHYNAQKVQINRIYEYHAWCSARLLFIVYYFPLFELFSMQIAVWKMYYAVKKSYFIKCHDDWIHCTNNVVLWVFVKDWTHSYCCFANISNNLCFNVFCHHFEYLQEFITENFCFFHFVYVFFTFFYFKNTHLITSFPKKNISGFMQEQDNHPITSNSHPSATANKAIHCLKWKGGGLQGLQG